MRSPAVTTTRRRQGALPPKRQRARRPRPAAHHPPRHLTSRPRPRRAAPPRARRPAARRRCARKRLKVDVLNQSAPKGSAGKVAARVRALNWPLGRVDNFNGTVTPTTVYYPPRRSAPPHVSWLEGCRANRACCRGSARCPTSGSRSSSRADASSGRCWWPPSPAAVRGAPRRARTAMIDHGMVGVCRVSRRMLRCVHDRGSRAQQAIRRHARRR